MAAPAVASSSRQQREQDGGAHEGLFVGQRICQYRHNAPRIVGRNAHRIEIFTSYKRIAKYLGKTCVREHGADPAAHTLGCSQPRARRGHGECARQTLIADQANDFFNKIGLVSEVRAPGWRSDHELRCLLLHSASHGLKKFLGPLRRDRHPCNLSRQICVDGDGGDLKRCFYRSETDVFTTAELQHELKSACRSIRGQSAIDTALIAARRFTRQFELSRTAGNRSGVKVRGLERDIGAGI